MAEFQESQPSGLRRSIEAAVLVALLAAFLTVSMVYHNPFARGADTRAAIGIIIGAALTLVMYSFLYRDNPLFKIAENLYVGVALGYGVIMTWRETLRPEVYDPLLRAPTLPALYDALLHRSVPILLGVMLLTRLSRTHSWLSRYAYGLLIGWGAGVGIVLYTDTYILQQLEAAARPLQAGAADAEAFSAAWWGNVGSVAGALSVLVGTVCVLFYFFFSVRHGPVGQKVSKVGIWFLMVAFGASFGYTVMGRLSLLIGRVRFLMFDWLQIPQ